MIITRQYFPHGDATSNVVHNVAKEFLNRGCEVHVLALTSNPDDSIVHEWEGVSVENIYLPCSIDRAQIRKEWKKHLFLTSFAVEQKVYSLVKGKIRKNFRVLTINPLFRDCYKKKILEYQKDTKIDLCIATLMPTEAAVAAIEVCKKETILSIYQLDTYWNNNWLPSEYQNDRKKYEEYLIRNVDYIIATPLIKRSDEVTFPNYREKIISAEFPMIRENKQQIKVTAHSGGKIHCVFLGKLYKGVRPPGLVVEIIKKIENSSIQFDFYGTGQHLISALLSEEKTEEKIYLYGAVPSVEAQEAQEAAHFLVNIDNTTNMQVPSKIFEYMSTGKPIINFYFNEDSPTLSYLRKYPNCINIFLHGELETETKKLESFILSANGTRISFSKVKELFAENTPEYVADLFYQEYLHVRQQKEI